MALTMQNKSTTILRRALWTIGSFGGSFALRLSSNIILSRLLAPEIFGVMVIINSIKVGVELLTDVGIEQNIVHHKNGLEDSFFNTAWTLQIVRGILLTTLFLLASTSLSEFYAIDRELFLVISFAPLVNSLASTSIFALVKNLQVKQRNVFELCMEALALCIYVTLALMTPTVWALVIGAILSIATRSFFSYFLAHPSHRLTINPSALKEIIKFGKWIMVTSLVTYAAANFDKIYLGKSVSLTALGIYGIARTIADLPAVLAGRLSYQVVFPVLSASRTGGDESLANELRSVRWRFVALAAFAIASLMAWSDVAIGIAYDPRYHEASWMLLGLLVGSWFSVLSNLNEALLLGQGHAAVSSVANVTRLFSLIILLPAGYAFFGLKGAIAGIAASEVFRYLFVLSAQRKSPFSFFRQDCSATTILLFVYFGWILLRSIFGLGSPLDQVR